MKRKTTTKIKKSRNRIGYAGGGAMSYGYTNPNSVDTGFDWMQVGEGAVAGAAAGSVVPGWGTLIGAVVGAGTGAIKASMSQNAARDERQGIIASNFGSKSRYDDSRLEGFAAQGTGGSMYMRKGGRVPYRNGGGTEEDDGQVQPTVRQMFNPGTYAYTLNRALRYPFDVASNIGEIIPDAMQYASTYFGDRELYPGSKKDIRDRAGARLRENLYENSPIYYDEGDLPEGFQESLNESADAVTATAGVAMLGPMAKVGGRYAGKVVKILKEAGFGRAAKVGVNKTVRGARKAKIYTDEFMYGADDIAGGARTVRRLEAAERPVFKIQPKPAKSKFPTKYKGKDVVAEPRFKFNKLQGVGRAKNFSKITANRRPYLYQSELPANAMRRGVRMKASLSGTGTKLKGFGSRVKDKFKKKTPKKTDIGSYTKAGIGSIPLAGIPIPGEQGDAIYDAHFEFGKNILEQDQVLGRKFSDQYEQEYRDRRPKINKMKRRTINRIDGYRRGGAIPNVQTGSSTKRIGAGVQVDTSKGGTDKIKANINGTPVYLDDEEIIVNDAQGQPVVLSDDLGTADQYRQELAMGGEPTQTALKYAEIAKSLNPNPQGGGRQFGGGGIDDKWLDKYTKQYGDYTNTYGRYARYDVGLGKGVDREDKRGMRQYGRTRKRIDKAYDKMGGLSSDEAGYFTKRYDPNINQYSDPEAYASGTMDDYRYNMAKSPYEAEQPSTVNEDLAGLPIQRTPYQRTKTMADSNQISRPNISPAQTQIARYQDYGFDDEEYVDDIPFNTKDIAARTSVGLREKYGLPRFAENANARTPNRFIPDTQNQGFKPPGFDYGVDGNIANPKQATMDIANAQLGNLKATGDTGGSKTPMSNNNKALIAQGATSLATLGLNALSMNKLNNTEFPKFTPYAYQNLDLDVNAPVYDRARSDIRRSTDTGIRQMVGSTSNTNIAQARAAAARANEINAFSGIASQEAGARGQIANINTAGRNRYHSDIGRLRAGYDMAEYQDKVSRIQTGLSLGQSATTSIDSLINNYRQGKVDDETISTLAALYDVDISDDPTMAVMLQRMKASGVKNIKAQFGT